MELKEHEVLVENKDGAELAVSMSYYNQNKSSLKMIEENGMKNKMKGATDQNKKSSTKKTDEDLKKEPESE
jgi:hypothetical protein